MDGFIVVLLFAIIITIGLILMYFLRGAFNTNDAHHIDKLPDSSDETYDNRRDPSHDKTL